MGDEPAPTDPPAGVEVIEASERPDLWAACFDTFGTEVLADFAVYSPLEISLEQWNTSWFGDPMFLALHGDEVIGCAGLDRDTDRPERAENALTGVRRTWRGRVGSHLKRHACMGRSQRTRRDLHLDAGRQHADAAPQRTPRLHHRPNQHRGLPAAPAQHLTATAPWTSEWVALGMTPQL